MSIDKSKKTVGIIGGMGPGATALLFQKLIDYTDAKSDAEHKCSLFLPIKSMNSPP